MSETDTTRAASGPGDAAAEEAAPGEAALDRLLADVAAREGAPPGGDFLARLEADALAAMPGSAPRPAPRAAGEGAGWADLLGGWLGFGSLGVAALTGLLIGIAPPAALQGYLDDTVAIGLLPDDVALVED
ncbi:hypothetical protein [Wenxinia saemankumensis]|uniref:Dihydroorotate dehydrogenase n=1 Tax=Wenxinia saemankumensis TaxID=1447782 RepID=A0A1M6CSY9_9RHOB|nr:hypothetical protein [Wenxinia saemankumensis]SHI64090.1 hypothetical protein SAMN05444417_1348 [Wenxinia saemankumensis]